MTLEFISIVTVGVVLAGLQLTMLRVMLNRFDRIDAWFDRIDAWFDRIEAGCDRLETGIARIEQCRGELWARPTD